VRLEAGLQQADLARLIGKDQSFISNIERAERRVDLLEFYAMARAMGLDPADLYRRATAKLPDRVQI
jgi:transcriptional regulator with XRE-family HTH domain